MSKAKAPVRVCTNPSGRLTDHRYTCGNGAAEVLVVWTDEYGALQDTTLRRADFPNDEKFTCTFLRDRGINPNDESRCLVEAAAR